MFGIYFAAKVPDSYDSVMAGERFNRFSDARRRHLPGPFGPEAGSVRRAQERPHSGHAAGRAAFAKI
jgi:hypothetical protein